ncbi:hypothetical protein [Pseudomonas sp. NPDC087817]|uniref:hypothetical protein n=1 Tax=Pseudomonas sp. NPDC087817 TaxID=3364451 RepID=UPI003813862A
MNAKTVVTNTITGTFTAKIEKQPDFAATRFTVSEGSDYFHFYGTEGDPHPLKNYRGIYIIVKKDVSGFKVAQFGYLDKQGEKEKFYEAEGGTFTFNFDETKRSYKMSFHVVAQYEIEKVDILGSFDLEVS